MFLIPCISPKPLQNIARTQPLVSHSPAIRLVRLMNGPSAVSCLVRQQCFVVLSFIHTGPLLISTAMCHSCLGCRLAFVLVMESLLPILCPCPGGFSFLSHSYAGLLSPPPSSYLNKSGEVPSPVQCYDSGDGP